MTVKEVAINQEVTPLTVRQWLYSGKLKAKQTTSGYEISEKQLSDFVEKCKSGEIKRRR